MTDTLLSLYSSLDLGSVEWKIFHIAIHKNALTPGELHKKVYLFFSPRKKASHLHTNNSQHTQHIETIRHLATERVLCVPQTEQTLQIQQN